MLEDLAYQYVALSEDNFRLLHYAVAILGGIVGGLTSRSTTELQRAPYFALSCLVFLATGAVSFASVPVLVPAMSGGFLWTIVAAELAISLVGGFFIVRIAQARSRDAYGHSRSAALAFIPIANFWLLLTPTRNEVFPNRTQTMPLLSGGFGVFAGFVLFFAGVALNVESEFAVEEITGSGELVLYDQDPTTAVVALAAGIETPMVVDETTTLIRMEADGPVLRYVYEVSNDPDSLSASHRSGLVRQNCNFEPLTPFIQNGVTLEHLYLRQNGSQIGTITVTNEICEHPEPEAPADPTDVDITDMIESSPIGELYRALRDYYPDEAEYFRDSMVTLLNEGVDDDEAFSTMLTVGAEIRQRYAANLRTAPDQSLRAILQSQTQMIAAFDDDPVLCNQVVMFGLGAIPEAERIVALIGSSAGFLFQVMYEGERSPVQRTQATDDDWDNLIVDFYAAGGTDDELDLIAQPILLNPQLCDATLRYLRVLTDADFPGADRLRAEMVAEMHEG